MSKFSGIMAAKREREPENEITPEIVSSSNGIADAKRRGRPTAKRSDPNYVQTSPYIKKTTLQSVKLELLQEGQGREYSELVEELLASWLENRKPK